MLSTLVTLLPVMLIGLVAGVLIGSVGIGGVIVVPALVYLLEVPIHGAVAAALAGFLASGVVGTWAHARGESIHGPTAFWLCAAALPATGIGAWAASLAPPLALEAAVGALAAVAGLRTLLIRGAGGGPLGGRPPSRLLLLTAGAATGFLSALTGTSGPLVLVPVLVGLKLPVLAAVGLAQAIQLPVAAVATAGNLALGAIDWRLAAGLGLGLAAGTWIGAQFAQRLPAALMHAMVAAVLTLVGAGMLIRVALLV